MAITLDIGLLELIQRHLRCGLLDRVMVFFTRLGDGGALWIAASLALLLFPKTRRAGAAMAAALLLEALCCNLLLKPLVARPRPFVLRPAVPLLIARPADFSFPSGHTGASFAAAFALYFSRSRLWGLAAAFAVVIGFSRLYLFVHYPTDVLAGALLGVLTGWVGSRLVRAAGPSIDRWRKGDRL